jgi:hypothetical protein
MLKLVTIIFYSVKGSSLWQSYFTQLKAQACDNYILLRQRLKLMTIIFYSVKGSSLWQLYFTQLKAQACDNYVLLS